jgi:hypothetical protein
MRVFVLGTGRCGTTTFIRACEHFDNYSAAHESRVRLIGGARFDYADQHVEADNRLSWMLGALAERFDRVDVLYVHLRRDRDEVVRSFARRWDAGHRTSIIKAFAHGIVMRPSDWAEADISSVCGHYVDVVTANIADFLRDRPSVEMWLHDIDTTFPDFAHRIGATGDLAAAVQELGTRHNASAPDV